ELLAPEAAGSSDNLAGLFVPTYGNIIVETSEDLIKTELKAGTVTLIGNTVADKKITVKNATLGGVTNPAVEISLDECVASWEDKLKE
ncbi:hypothetical protein NXH64_15045, partial [Butyrivibrio fibrisolvens]|nr:hypothetical protein [Butyrivibrio fibrisolvens]